MNKLTIIGNLTRDPELRQTRDSIAVCTFTVAVNRRKAQGNGQPEADFFRVTAWRGLAENCGKYLKKGNKVAVVGSLQNRSYEDKDGIKRNVTDVVANEVEFLTPKSAQGESSDDASVSSAKRERPQLEAIDDNQLPF